MKLYFEFVIVLVFFIFTNFTPLFANDFKETYVVEIKSKSYYKQRFWLDVVVMEFLDAPFFLPHHPRFK